MKKGFYFVSLMSAVLLMVVILIYTDPDWDRQHSAFALIFSILVFSANMAVLVIYPLMKTEFLARMVKGMGLVSAIAILLLAATGHSNYAVRTKFTQINSLSSSIASPKP